MKVTLNSKELGEAVAEYLKRRGVAVTTDQVKFLGRSGSATYHNLEHTAEVEGVTLPPQEGPYR